MADNPQEKYQSEADLVKWVHDQMKDSARASSSWRGDAEEDFAFYAGEQWSSEDAQLLKDQGRPPVVFNRAARTINAVAGLEVQNRQEVRYVPRETSDNALADYYSAVVKWARDQTDAEDEDSEAFQDALTCGMGWTQTRLDYDIDQEGMIEVSRYDPLEAFWDHNARKRNLADRKWCARVKRYSNAEDVKAQWPKYTGLGETQGVNNAGAYMKDSHKPIDASPPYYDGNNSTQSQTKPIEIICFNWYELEKVYRVVTPEKPVFIPEDRFERIKDQVDLMGLQYIKQKRRKYKIAYVAGAQLLEVVDSPVQSGFLFNCITGLRNRNENTWFGLMRLMIDPQRWANKWLSQIMHILNSNSKGGLLAEKDAFENQTKAEKEWADPQAITWLRAGALSGGKIEQKKMAEVPAGFHMLMQQAIEAISDTPGVNAELMGVVSREQPGILEMTRKQAGVTMLGMFFDALRRYRKAQGRVMADLVRDYISDGRKIRIIGPEGKPEVIALMKDQLSFTTDIVIDDAPNSPSMKDKVFTVMQALIPQFAKLGFPVPPEILDYLPLPAAAIEKWKAMMEKTPQVQAMEQDAQMLMREEKVTEIEKDKADIALKRAQAAKLALEATPEGMQAQREQDMLMHAADIQARERESQAKIESEERLQMMKISSDVQGKNADREVNERVEGMKVQASKEPKVAINAGQELKEFVSEVTQGQKTLESAIQKQGDTLDKGLTALAEAIKYQASVTRKAKKNPKTGEWESSVAG